MPLRFCSLGSGSTGNGTLVEAGSGSTFSRVLIDCGFSLREFEARLARTGLLVGVAELEQGLRTDARSAERESEHGAGQAGFEGVALLDFHVVS